MNAAYIFQMLVTAIVMMVIGALWYSPVLFGKRWMKLMSMTENSMKEMKAGGKNQGMWKLYLGHFIFIVISVVVLKFFLSGMLSLDWKDGAFIGFLAWLGFILPKDVATMTWENKKLELVIINTSSSLVTLVVGAIILTVWM